MNGRRAAAGLLFLCTLFAALPILGAGPFVQGLTWRYKGGSVVASFGVADAVDRPELKEAILSTRPVTLLFTAQIIKHRALWKNKTVAERVVAHTVRYDTLTRQFKVETTLDDEKVDERVLASWREMASYMQKVEDLALTSVANLEPSEGSYTLRVRVHVMDNFVLWIIPWDVQTPWVSQTLVTP